MPSVIDNLPRGVSILRVSWGDAGRFFGDQEPQMLANIANGIAGTIRKTHGIQTFGGQMARESNGNYIAMLAVMKP
jgi:hypothetical protein